MIDQIKICSSVTKLKDINCINELKSLGIFASDVYVHGNSYLYKEERNEIHILKGSENIGALLTGQMKHLSNGLITMNTKFDAYRW